MRNLNDNEIKVNQQMGELTAHLSGAWHNLTNMGRLFDELGEHERRVECYSLIDKIVAASNAVAEFENKREPATDDWSFLDGEIELE